MPIPEKNYLKGWPKFSFNRMEKSFFGGEMIKKRGIFLVLLALVVFSVNAQEIVENPKKPLSKNAGRIVELKEVWRIDDTGADYYFRYPHNLKIAPDGSLFIADQDQLLQFDPEGKFLRNYFKKGQGPGEMQEIGNYFFSEKAIIVHDRSLQKILWFGFNGELMKDFRIHKLPSYAWLHLFYNDNYYFFGERIPSTGGRPSVIDVPNDLISATEKGEEVETLISFPVESFAISFEKPVAMASIAELITIPYRDKYLVICHTQDYLLKIYDVKSEKIIRSFRRNYNRVKVPEGRRVGGAIGMGGKMYRPPRKYLNDVTKLLEFNDLFWAMTSTADKDKRVLIDVYNFEGQYLDNFYLKFPEEIDPILIGYRPMSISGDYLFMVAHNEDDTSSIKKYRVEDKSRK
jgi:hypothetical protein